MSRELKKAYSLFLLGGAISIGAWVALQDFGPSLGDRINEGICYRLGGAWDNKAHSCILEKSRGANVLIIDKHSILCYLSQLWR